MLDSPMQASLIDRLGPLLGPRGLLTGAPEMAAAGQDWRRLFDHPPLAVLRPATAAELSAAVQECNRLGVAMVPQGGNTSMVGGGVPGGPGQVVVSFARMNHIHAADATDLTLTVEAGVTLKAAQDAAAAAGCLLPLSISSEGTATIGGVLATNAGGNNTVRYGNARDLVLGLEAVLPDGAVWHGLRRLRKDNTGYCLRQLLVGSEGTLGFITAAVLKLAPQSRQREVALCAVPSVDAALALFARFQQHDPAAVQAFEYMGGAGMALVVRHIPGATLPIAPAPHYALIELATPRAGEDLRTALEAVLEQALEAGTVTDAAVATSDAQRLAIWKLREEHAEAQKREGASVKNDVSVPVSRVPELLRRGEAAVAALIPGVRCVAFGHIGDGNIHFNFEQPEGMDGAAFLARDHDIMDAVGAVVQALDGSFSAEHGVGQLKPYMMPGWRGGAELDAMRKIKAALDPLGLMNPGKIFS